MLVTFDAIVLTSKELELSLLASSATLGDTSWARLRLTTELTSQNLPDSQFHLVSKTRPTKTLLDAGSQLKLCRTLKLLFWVQGGVWWVSWFPTVMIIRLSQPPAGWLGLSLATEQMYTGRGNTAHTLFMGTPIRQPSDNIQKTSRLLPDTLKTPQIL